MSRKVLYFPFSFFLYIGDVLLWSLALFQQMSRTCVIHKQIKQSSQLENRILESEKSLLQVGTALALFWPLFRWGSGR
jgi:hypothetical protein